MTWYNVDELVQYRLEESISFIANTLSDDFHTQATPFPLCIEMAEKVGSYLDSERKWLVIANLEFLLVLRKYFEYRGWNFEDHVSFATPCEQKAEFARFIGVKNIIKYSYSNFKESWNVSKKFDVIIGNPPYNLPIDKDKTLGTQGAKVWKNFILLAFEILNENGYLCYITPNNWVMKTNSLHNFMFNKKIFYMNLCIKEQGYFPNIGTTIGAYIIRNCDTDNICEFDTINGVIDKFYYSPEKMIGLMGNSKELVSIFDKTINSNLEKIDARTNSFNSANLSKDRNDEFKYEVFTNWESKWTNIIPPDYGSKKVLMAGFLTRRFYSQRGYWIEFDRLGFKTVKTESGKEHYFVVNSDLEGETLSWYLVHSKLIRFLTNSFSSNQYVQWPIVRSLPKIDFSRSWTDQELYEYFNLTQEEINLIESSVK
jgi:hypothetical protein